MTLYGTLTIIDPGGEQQTIALDQAEIIIGRDVGSDIRLDDPRVSRVHARINCGPAGCSIVDLVSRHGTRVDGQIIEQPVDITPGANVEIGGFQLVFQPEDAPMAAAITASLPYAAAPTLVGGRRQASGRSDGFRDRPGLVVVATTASVLVLAWLACLAAYLIGVDVLMRPALASLRNVAPGFGESLALYYDNLHGESPAVAEEVPTATPTAAAPEATEPAPESPVAEAPTPTEAPPTEEPAGDSSQEEAAPPPEEDTGPPSVVVRNQSNLAFCGVFIRAAGETFWGDNRQPGTPLHIGEDESYALPGAGVYDVRVMDCSSPRITLENKYDVQVSGPTEWLVDSRFTLPPTSTPTPTLTPTPEATPYVVFFADETTIDVGNCTDVHWNTQNISAVYFQENPVVGNDDRTVCPDSTKTYHLMVVYRDDTEHDFYVTIKVIEATATP